MAQAATLQIVPSRPEGLAPAPGPAVASENSTVPRRSVPVNDSQSLSRPERGRGWFDSARRAPSAIRAVIIAGLSNQGQFWHNAYPKIANTCAVLGLLLAVIFGFAQWIAQDKSIAIAKESELITLALSCSDKGIKNTSVCQQFLEKYPDGPAVTRRETIARAYFRHNGSKGVEHLRITLEGVAVHLAMLDQFVQKENTRFRSALRISDSQLSTAHMEDITEGERFFLRRMELLITTLARQQPTSPNPTPASTVVAVVTRLLVVVIGFPLLIIMIGAVLIPMAAIIMTQTTDFGLFLSLGFLICVIDPVACWVLLQFGRLYNVLAIWTLGVTRA